QNVGVESCTVTHIDITTGGDKGFAFTITPFGNITAYPGLPKILSSGESMTVEILFSAPSSYDHSTVVGKIQIQANERPHEVTTVDLVAAINFVSVCDHLTVSPPSLSYGVVTLGRRRARS